MALFKSYSPLAEVSGRIIYPVVNGLPEFSSAISALFAEEGLPEVDPEIWYRQQKFLNALEGVLKKFGPNTLFLLGKLVTESFPHQFDDIKASLLAVNVIYQATHRNGDVGSIELTEFSYEKNSAVMKCHVPYPPEFQRGILISMIRKYKSSYGLVNVSNCPPSSGEVEGGDIYQFEINW